MQTLTTGRHARPYGVGMGNTDGRRRSGGIIGIVVIAGYLVLRFGFLAYREHEQGMSNGQIAVTLLLVAAAAFAVVEIVLAVRNAQTRRREEALATKHPGALLVPVMLQRDAARELTNAAQMLGIPVDSVPRRGLATLVADRNGLGVYTGGAEPRLVLGLQRQFVQSVGNGETSAAGRYAFGKVEALRIVVSNGQWTSVDLPVYRTVIGFPKHERGEALDGRVRMVALAAGVQLQPSA